MTDESAEVDPEAGVTWEFESYGEYLELIERRDAVAAVAGHDARHALVARGAE